MNNENTIPIFILGSGRSGTLQMSQLLAETGEIESHHEYSFETVLKQAVLYKMKMISNSEIKSFLNEIHLSGVKYSSKNYWLDSSNALPWIIEPLQEIFPNAKFIHLIRDGRKVVSSFYNKFEKIIYEDQAVEALKIWANNPNKNQIPPPEKKYWRPIPLKDSKDYDRFQQFNRWQRLSFYWKEVNEQIHSSLKLLPAENTHFVRLEELTTQAIKLEQFFNFIGISYKKDYFQQIQKPVNVAIPKNFKLSKKELIEFNEIAGDCMEQFGYNDEREYETKY